MRPSSGAKFGTFLQIINSKQIREINQEMLLIRPSKIYLKKKFQKLQSFSQLPHELPKNLRLRILGN